MLRTDLDTPLLMGPSTAAKLSRRCFCLCFPGILFIFCAVFGATQCSAQDVAEAARQERAQKESKQKKSKQAIDAQSFPADHSLGDVARRFRKQKQSQKLQRSAEFHLPFADAPALASPKPPVMPLRPPVSNPAPPRFAPYQQPVKRSPFERPKAFFSAPALVMPSRPPAVRVTPSQPAAPIPPSAPAKLNVVTIKPGDSLWKLAQQNLGKGLRWHDLLAVNPGIVDANHIVAGSQIYLPATVSSPLRTAAKITVRKGDTLSKIAQTQLGHASYWSCIARANPAVHDANIIYEGQLLFLPPSCTP